MHTDMGKNSAAPYPVLPSTTPHHDLSFPKMTSWQQWRIQNFGTEAEEYEVEVEAQPPLQKIV